ncbi:MAG: bifunctional diaminohydroxyphosphoribosylaminopyrimidine deaminase/5-amino-6-(5-phosphoribosylamino)uracil reductase RibD [Limisphaerales bacterium]
MESDADYMRLALRLAKRGFGRIAPNPMVGAVLVRKNEIVGQGWHHRAGAPHAEIEALAQARKNGGAKGSTLYVTLEPCCTHGRTPPCTEAIMAAGIRRVVAAVGDPNPSHLGRGLKILERAGITVTAGVLAEEAAALNETFFHWIVCRRPFVTVKAAMSLDGKIATVTGESKWITGEAARAQGMRLRMGSDAVLVGINTILRDDPSLTVRGRRDGQERLRRRIILDAQARTPLGAKVVSDAASDSTTVVVTRTAPKERVAVLRKKARVLVAPATKKGIRLRWLLDRLGRENITALLVEGGGETNASFLEQGLAQRVAFFYAPIVLGGRGAAKAVAGNGVAWQGGLRLREAAWRRLGNDLFLTARPDEH